MDVPGGRGPVLRAALVCGPRDDRLRQWARVALTAGGMSVASDAGLEPVPLIVAGDVDVVVVVVTEAGEAAAAIRRLTATPGCPPVVVVAPSVHIADFAAVAAAGARGYLLDDMEPGALARALACAAQGKTVVPRGVVARLNEQIRADGDPGLLVPESPLTRRERQVLTLLRDGLSTNAIAERLDVTPVTARSHIASIVRKLGVADREVARVTPVDLWRPLSAVRKASPR